jgi:hypothetical protein
MKSRNNHTLRSAVRMQNRKKQNHSRHKKKFSIYHKKRQRRKEEILEIPASIV